ncbi:GerMN domain-containing protein [uncultured Cellulomonas sp.]|uniref:GerMN domain-containing protein n=1 Tax=uncultured Cellulomonas sp. TaxID=189682 RepID=UPI002636EE58|nr:GerMN domain-containing protein [uncultured Cellulomonas sp.]
MTRAARALLAVVMCVVLAGCGMSAQRRPVAIDVPLPTTPTSQPAPEGARSVTVYLVREDRLEAVRRAAQDRSVATALQLLALGPTDEEGRVGLRSAVPPESARMIGTDPATGTAVVEVTAEFVATLGASQLLAVAQVVWTVTESPDVRRIRMTRDGEPIDVPTDEGLTRQPVGRDDFVLVAPGPQPTAPAVDPPCEPAVPC